MNKKLEFCAALRYNIAEKKKEFLRGRVQFPTGGIVRDLLCTITQRLIWCNSKTDSIVWMREEICDIQWLDVFPDIFYIGVLFL